jgi:hypothetical protein
MSGNQYLTTTTVGLSFFNSFPTRSQLRGLTELILRKILRSGGGGVSENWVVPGKINSGY